MKEKKLRIVYLTSVEHSGSTLLACKLGDHPEISTVGEFGTPFPENGKCSCGHLYNICPVWRNWEEKAKNSGIDFSLGNFDINVLPDPKGGFWEDLFYYQFPNKIFDHLRDLLFLPFPARMQKVKKQIYKSIQLAKALCELQETKVFLDTTKNPIQIRFLQQHPDIDLKVICLVRDGRGVMNSLLTKETTYTPESAVDSWLWGIRNMQRAVKHYMGGKNVYFLRLEDLCYSPDEKLSELYSFIGVNEDDVQFNDSQKHRHIVGNRMRLFFDGTIRKPDESWRKELSKHNIALFEKKAGHVNRMYGYK